jgi:hypothetical protein
LSIISLAAYLIVSWRRKHLLYKEVILHENLLRLLKLRVESWRDVYFWLRPSLGFALTIVVACSLETVTLLLILTFLVINLIYIRVALVTVSCGLRALTTPTSYIAFI